MKYHIRGNAICGNCLINLPFEEGMSPGRYTYWSAPKYIDIQANSCSLSGIRYYLKMSKIMNIEHPKDFHIVNSV